jgi:hypothetical protein
MRCSFDPFGFPQAAGKGFIQARFGNVSPAWIAGNNLRPAAVSVHFPLIDCAKPSSASRRSASGRTESTAEWESPITTIAAQSSMEFGFIRCSPQKTPASRPGCYNAIGSPAGSAIVWCRFGGNQQGATKMGAIGLCTFGPYSSHLAKLKDLNLSVTPITDTGMEFVGEMTVLEELHLYNTLVTDEGLKYLERLVGLKKLDLWYNNITDAGLKHLSRLANLKEIELFHTQVTRDGIRELQKSMPNCKISGP